MSASVDNGYKALVELLKENDRFLNMAVEGGDTIYAIDYVGDEVIEKKVLAVHLMAAADAEYMQLVAVQKIQIELMRQRIKDKDKQIAFLKSLIQ